MSQQLINRSPDLKRLRDEGYDLEIRSAHLLIKSVPHVNSRQEIKLGTLVSDLCLAGDTTTIPRDHVALFAGDYPCNKDGSAIKQIMNQTLNQQIDKDLVVNFSFSSKPPDGYKDYYDKMTTYIAIISNPARSIDPDVTARIFPVVESAQSESVFNYWDTASSRAGIGAATRKLEIGKLGIVGMGGTGSYLLDLIAKTPVKEIHLFDGDKFLNHNAFRSPGAPSVDELRSNPQKVNYFKEQYSKMHRHIIAHDFYVDASNVDQLREMSFVFLSLDRGGNKRLIIERLEEWGIPFIDVGLGVDLVDEAIGGILRVTTSTANKREHVWTKQRVPFSNEDAGNDYSRNIQIADLNALNATLAVIKWKKLAGFYRDLEQEHYSVYTIDGSMLTNEDQP
jgi:hypothetical protein